MPTARLRLNGLVCDMVMVKLGNDTARVESLERWAMLAVPEKLHFEPGGRYVKFTVELLVFSVKELL